MGGLGWSKIEDDLVRNNYRTLDQRTMMDLLPHRSWQAICKRASDMHTTKRASRFFSEQERFNLYCHLLQNGCIEWTGGLSHNGYGQWKLNNKHIRAHVFAYVQKFGDIPDGLVLDHLCRNRKCVNPDHLEPVTIRENVLRGMGIAAINARKTHCKRGHEFSKKNTYVYPDGRRECRTCRVTIHYKRQK